ncbi:G2/mitotic-specific cyclin-B-like [Drosophila takahashii]|uniref:G2/mitotic-specific cyclin-B-like n=1 Tax=Drosophila takahashii TaxID=29030 RepID=UPI001CF7EE0D|nr:G2/mitotic-specific cyclin-B-like [Drosophila takahashii]
MVGTTLKLRGDENASENFRQVQLKKLTEPLQEVTTKRAALGDLQNRGLNRAIAAKDAAQKDSKDLKLTDALRNAKARVDTHWKKQAQGTITNGNTAAPPKANEAGVSAFLQSNSVRTRVPAKTTVEPVRIKVKASSNENANEDSSLSNKSLTKLRAALAKPVRGVTVARKEILEAKKEVTEAKKEATRMPLIKATFPTTMSLSSKRLAGIEDIDANDKDNLVLVSEYANDIYDYLYQVELQQPIHKDHLAGQKEVSHKMRAVLIDWINEVHLQFHLAAETFQLAVAIIDRYLQVVKDTKRTYLQLVGVTALFTATKYEELFPPAIGDFVFITDDTYTTRQIRQMELRILKAIDCNLSRPLPIHFLRRYSKAAGAEDEHHAMSKYFIELATVEYDMASYRPSEIAAASLFLSLHLLNGNYRAGTGFNDRHWTPTLTYYSRYSAAHLRPITRQIAKLARDAPQGKLKAIYSKYQGSKFQRIALRTELTGALIDSIVSSLRK